MKRLFYGSFWCFISLLFSLSWGVALAQDAPVKADNFTELQQKVDKLTQAVDLLKEKKETSSGALSASKFNFGGYGEIHANMGEATLRPKWTFIASSFTWAMILTIGSDFIPKPR